MINIELYDNSKQICSKIYYEYKKLLTKQNGGAKFVKSINVAYNNKEYTFIYEDGDDNEKLYMLYDKENNMRCCMIIIDPNEHIAIIENISGDLQGCPNGSKILELSIKFLKENKKNFNINKITLCDMSKKQCFGKTINFADMYTLLYGKTWYMKHGFLPYDNLTNQLNKPVLKIAYNNKKIMDTANISGLVNLEKYIKKYAQKSYNVDALIKKINSIKNKKVTFLVQFLLKSYDEQSCTLFYNIYKKIMKELGLVSMHGKSFYMKI